MLACMLCSFEFCSHALLLNDLQWETEFSRCCIHPKQKDQWKSHNDVSCRSLWEFTACQEITNVAEVTSCLSFELLQIQILLLQTGTSCLDCSVQEAFTKLVANSPKSISSFLMQRTTLLLHVMSTACDEHCTWWALHVLLPVLHQVAQKLFAVGNGRRLSKQLQGWHWPPLCWV